MRYTGDLVLSIRDNGNGIDPEIAARGKPGQFGLKGIQERAARIGGTLSIFSSPDGGTEIELLVPKRSVFR